MIAKNSQFRDADAVVVGGGLAGLVSATLLARQGRSVVLLEQNKHLGGRASTNLRSGVHFNLGPRALYVKGEAMRVLCDLKIPLSGKFPNPGKPVGLYRGQTYRLPRGLSDLLTTRLLSLRDKWKLSRFFSSVPKLDTDQLRHQSVSQWLQANYGRGSLAGLLGGLIRLSTYADDLDHLSAGAALDQFRIGLEGNVWYLDGGWQSIIDGLRALATQLGVQISETSAVEAIRNEEEGVTLSLKEGRSLSAKTAVLAVAPETAVGMLNLSESHPLSRWTRSAKLVRAACLDIALEALPRPEQRFTLGLDVPYYFSVHSAAAKLAPSGVAVIHVMKYLKAEDATPAKQLEVELEALLDRVQPGWRQLVVTRRFLPNMIVSHALPEAREGGLAGRPGPIVPERPGVYLAGDWVGARGMLADASAASAEQATRLALAQINASQSSGILQHA